MNEQERSLYVGVLYVGWGWCVGVSLSSLRAVIFCWLWNIACDVSKPDFPYSKKDGRFGVLGKWYCHCHFERGGITVADINTQLLAAVGAFLGQWLLKTN